MAMLLVFLCGQVASAITIREENEVAGDFIRMIRSHYRLIDDPVVNDYITELGQRILSAFPEQPFRYHFYVVESDVFNAFAGPGGHVFIHSGLLQALPNEESLAGIIAHEISHVHSRHISDRIERSKKIGIGTLAGVAAGILVGVAGNAQAGGALTVGALAGSQSAALAYSRDDEMQRLIKDASNWGDVPFAQSAQALGLPLWISSDFIPFQAVFAVNFAAENGQQIGESISLALTRMLRESVLNGD